MANTINKQILLNGSRDYIIHYTIQGDGATGDITNTLIFGTTGDCGTNDSVEKIQYSTSLCSAVLLFDATIKVPFCNLAKDMTASLDFTQSQPIVNNAGAGKTGDVLITTTGLGTAGAALSVIVKMRKK